MKIPKSNKKSYRENNEILNKKCQRLGMSDEVVLGIEKLKQMSWPKEVQDEYRNEIEGVDTNYKALAAERSEGRSEGQLRGLITAFLKSERLDEEDIEDVSEKFSRDFVRNIWNTIHIKIAEKLKRRMSPIRQLLTPIIC
jgi:hypothetical protein